MRNGRCFDARVVETGEGYAELTFEGDGASRLLGESGGHRWQRVPPSEKRGRTHSSTVTVVVMPVDEQRDQQGLKASDLVVETMRGSGPGGQHRNQTESAVRITHRPTGLKVRICMDRSQHRNKALALQVLGARVAEQARSQATLEKSHDRRALAGTGQRSDKRRSYREQDNLVIDGPTGMKSRLSRFLAGELPLLD